MRAALVSSLFLGLVMSLGTLAAFHSARAAEDEEETEVRHCCCTYCEGCDPRSCDCVECDCCNE